MSTFRLANGLSVILALRPASPTTSVWVWYRVGSVNEHPGITGVSHWMEHMMFQGTRQFRKGEIDRAIFEVGGTSNAFTDTDFTAYFATVPRERVDVPLRIEADRMLDARVDPTEAERERQVVLSEREGNENRAEFRVEEELLSLAYRRHPYRWDPLGYAEDMRSMPTSALGDYYRRFYGPRNAILTVAGGFDPPTLRRAIVRRFGGLRATGENPIVGDREPEPSGPRRAELTGPGSTPLLSFAWPAPPIRDARAPAAMMLDLLLGGETGLFSPRPFGGRSGEHPASRLYRALVEPGLAVRASSEYRPRLYPGLFDIQAQAAPGIPLDRLEEAILREVERIGRNGPTRAELSTARAMLARSAALAYEGSSAAAFRLGWFAAYGSLALEGKLRRALVRLRPDDVRSEARRLFRRERSVCVRYEPEGGGHGG